MTRTTMKPRASLTVRIVLAVMAALLVMAALWAIVNLAAVNSYNQATQSLQENISTSRKDDADWDKLHTRQQQTDAQFNEASPPTLRNRVNQVTRTTKTYPTNNVGK